MQLKDRFYPIPFIVSGIYFLRAQTDLIRYYRLKANPKFSPVGSLKELKNFYLVQIGKIIINPQMSKLANNVRKRFIIAIATVILTQLVYIFKIDGLKKKKCLKHTGDSFLILSS